MVGSFCRRLRDRYDGSAKAVDGGGVCLVRAGRCRQCFEGQGYLVGSFCRRVRDRHDGSAKAVDGEGVCLGREACPDR